MTTDRTALISSGSTDRTVTCSSIDRTGVSPLTVVRNRVYLPWAPIPEGGLVDLPGRGAAYVTDTPGPDPRSPTVVLLHALGCTGIHEVKAGHAACVLAVERFVPALMEATLTVNARRRDFPRRGRPA